ncbi:MAG: SufS family cysteine desulfurase [Candidatus Izemoplasmatales bacterium]|nr:SufS family cysteine desulfurase [Candidatus Izemoplasmatales bacterium]
MNINKWRQDFPQIKNNLVYLDSAAMSLKPLSVIESVNHYYQDLSVNIHRGLYDISVEATTLYENTREVIAKYVNASVEEIVYTRGTTASLNLVASSYGLSHLHEGDEVIVSELEHHSSIIPWQEVAKKTKAILKYIPLDIDGRITLENFQTVLSDKTKVIALTYVSNVMGYITPIDQITHIAHQKNIIVVVDAAQALPHFRIDVKALDIDFLAFSGHKMLGPTGIGILYGKKHLLNSLEPTEFGGDMNDEVTKESASWKDSPYRFEAGTMPVASVIGFKDAFDYFNKYSIDEIEKHTMSIYRYTMARLSKIDGIEIYNPKSDTAIIAFNIKNVPSHDAVSFYSEKNICLRSGHHCAQLVTKWLGVPACLRASFYLYNDFKDADAFVDATIEAVSFFKRLGF